MTQQSKHTPGPWQYPDDGFVRGFDSSLIASVARGPSEYAEANARLIAAAPEMYELLEKVAKTAETAASKPDKQEVCAVLLEVVLPHLGEESRRIKAAIDGGEI